MRAFKAGDTGRAREIDAELRPAFDLLGITTNLIPIKAALALLGHYVADSGCRSCRPPPTSSSAFVAASRGSGSSSLPSSVHERLVALLRDEGVEFRLTHHEAVTTSEAAAAVRSADPSTGAKAMLVKGKTGFVLAVLAGDRRVDWKLLAPLVGKGARFANDDELIEVTGLTKGAVPPFGGLFGVATIYDESLLEVEAAGFQRRKPDRFRRHAPERPDPGGRRRSGRRSLRGRHDRERHLAEDEDLGLLEVHRLERGHDLRAELRAGVRPSSSSAASGRRARGTGGRWSARRTRRRRGRSARAAGSPRPSARPGSPSRPCARGSSARSARRSAAGRPPGGCTRR